MGGGQIRKFKRSTRELLPRPLRRVSRRKWIPWSWIERLHQELPEENLQALFAAYRLISTELPINTLASRSIPGEYAGCHRCGYCCAQLNPGPVEKYEFDKWVDRKALIKDFFHACERPRSPPHFDGFYFQGVRLKQCPFLLVNPKDNKQFCSVYHFGPGHRPSACENFRPNYPRCEITQKPLVF